MPHHAPCAGGCGKPMPITPTSLAPGTATCQPCRRAGKAPTSAYRFRGPNWKPRQPRTPSKMHGRTCEICTATYKATYPKQRTCGRICGGILNKRERPPIPIRWTQPALNLTPCRRCGSAMITAGWGQDCGCPIYTPLPDQICSCNECAAIFTVSYTGKPGNRRSAYCSPRCSRRASRRAQRRKGGGFTIADGARQAIYSRDALVCHLCLRGALPDTHWLHPWHPTLDHLIPRSQQGSDHPTNLATAHRWCNTMRGTTPLPETQQQPIQWTTESGLTTTSRWVFPWATLGPPTREDDRYATL
jgi:hypothetical protein